MSLGRCNSEPVLRRTARDPAEKRFLHFLDHYSQRNRPDRPVSRAQTQPYRVIVTDASDARIDRGLRHRSQPSLPSAQKRPKSGAPVSPMTALLRRPSSALSRDSPGKITAIRQRVLSKIAIGIHVALLNAKISQKPGEIQLEEPMREATVEHVQRIYRQFLRFKALESDRAAEAQYLHQVKLVQEAWCENSGPQAAQDDSFSRNPWIQRVRTHCRVCAGPHSSIGWNKKPVVEYNRRIDGQWLLYWEESSFGGRCVPVQSKLRGSRLVCYFHGRSLLHPLLTLLKCYHGSHSMNLKPGSNGSKVNQVALDNTLSVEFPHVFWEIIVAWPRKASVGHRQDW